MLMQGVIAGISVEFEMPDDWGLQIVAVENTCANGIWLRAYHETELPRWCYLPYVNSLEFQEWEYTQ